MPACEDKSASGRRKLSCCGPDTPRKQPDFALSCAFERRNPTINRDDFRGRGKRCRSNALPQSFEDVEGRFSALGRIRYRAASGA